MRGHGEERHGRGGIVLMRDGVLEVQSRPFSPRFDRIPRGDFRLGGSRETALDVKILLERGSASCTRYGVGYELLLVYYVREAPWSSFSDREQRIIKKTARAFEERLRQGGFLPKVKVTEFPADMT
jgi:hypothetical protein